MWGAVKKKKCMDYAMNFGEVKLTRIHGKNKVLKFGLTKKKVCLVEEKIHVLILWKQSWWEKMILHPK